MTSMQCCHLWIVIYVLRNVAQWSRSLMSWVVVIPKEGWTGTRPSIFWYDTDFLDFFLKNFFLEIFLFFFKFFCKSVSYQKKDGRGMTTTQDIGDLFAWRSPIQQTFIKSMPHSPQMNGLFPECFTSWSFSWLGYTNTLPQVLHVRSPTPLCAT